MGLIGRVLINAIAIAVAAVLIPGISYGHTAYGYGDADKWHAIYEANRDKIKDPDLIHPGQVLTLPSN